MFQILRGFKLRLKFLGVWWYGIFLTIAKHWKLDYCCAITKYFTCLFITLLPFVTVNLNYIHFNLINIEHILLVGSGSMDPSANKMGAQVTQTYSDCHFMLILHRPIWMPFCVRSHGPILHMGNLYTAQRLEYEYRSIDKSEKLYRKILLCDLNIRTEDSLLKHEIYRKTKSLLNLGSETGQLLSN